MNTKRPPLLSDERLANMAEWTGDSTLTQMKHVRDLYEAARAKDAELIQRLLDYIAHDPMDHVVYYANGGWSKDKVLSAAKSAGFTPSNT